MPREIEEVFSCYIFWLFVWGWLGGVLNILKEIIKHSKKHNNVNFFFDHLELTVQKNFTAKHVD